MRIIFMGTPQFAVPSLGALIASSHEVVAVYSQPPRPAGRGMKLTPSPVQQLAQEHGITVLTPVSLKSSEEQEKFRALGADVAVVVAYGLLLPQAILDGTKLGCVNIHPSALPRWRGAAPIQRTVMAGDATTEICIMKMDAGLDTGDVMLRKSFPVAPGMNAGDLHDQLAQLAPPLLLDALSQMENGSVKFEKQSEDGVTYAQKISKDEAKLDLTRPAQEVLQKILGLAPFPGAYVEHEGERIKILDCHASEGWHPRVSSSALPDVDPGLRRDDDGKLVLQCADGALFPTLLQRAGGKRLPVAEFLAGFQ